MRINRADSTLRHGWVVSSNSGPADISSDNGIGSIETDGVQGFSYGVLAEAPDKDGPRFNAPQWVTDIKLFRSFGRALLEARTKKFPTMDEFQGSKCEVDIQVLWAYFVDHASYEEVFERFCKGKGETYGTVNISTSDAKNVEQAVKLAAERSGTTSFYDDETSSFMYLDQTATPGPKAFKRITARKVNTEIYRVNFRLDDGDQYYLPEKLDPSKNNGDTRRLQRYIDDLVNEGYALLGLAKPNEADRELAREERRAEEESQIARAQYGRGTDPDQYVTQKEAAKYLYKPSQATTEHLENKRVAALGNSIRTKIMDEMSANFSPAQLRAWQRHTGETAYQNLLELTRVELAKSRFIQTLPWQPPIEPASVVEFKPTAVSPDILRMSIQLLIASLAQSRSELQSLAA